MTQAKRLTVCVVDDDEAVRDSMCVILESHGMAVRPYASARSFLDSNQTHRTAACTVLDIHMPDMNGLELLGEIRARRMTIPVVVMTGGADAVLRGRAMQAGAAALLDKPVHDADLIRAIEHAAHKRKKAEVS